MGYFAGRSATLVHKFVLHVMCMLLLTFLFICEDEETIAAMGDSQVPSSLPESPSARRMPPRHVPLLQFFIVPSCVISAYINCTKFLQSFARFYVRATEHLSMRHGSWWSGGANMSESQVYPKTFGRAESSLH